MASPGAVQHATQHEFIVTKIVAAWPHLPTSTRLELLPTFVQVQLHVRLLQPGVSSRVAVADAGWVRAAPVLLGHVHVQRRMAR